MSRRIEPELDEVELWIIDWEFVQIGDPAWDLAGALHDFLIFWTSSMPQDPLLPAQAMIDQARYPLEVLRGAIRSMWDAYQSVAGLGLDEAKSLLDRAVAFSATRLIMAAHEISAEMMQLPVQAVILLQISANVLANPELGRIHLYGITSPGPVRDD